MDLVDSDSESYQDEDTLSMGSGLRAEAAFSLKMINAPVTLKDKYNPHNQAFFYFFLTNLEEALTSFKVKNCSVETCSDVTSQSTTASFRQ